MGFLISINGADFQPYQAQVPMAPQPRPVKEVMASAEVARGTKPESESGEDFSQFLAKAVGIKQYQQKVEERAHEVKKAIHVKDIMTCSLTTVHPDRVLSEVEEIFAAEGFRHLPVVHQEDARLCGMISDRDLLRAQAQGISKNSKVADMMTEKVIVVTPDTLILEMALAMIQEKISALPVVQSEQGELVGIVTTTDILKSLIHRSPLELWV